MSWLVFCAHFVPTLVQDLMSAIFSLSVLQNGQRTKNIKGRRTKGPDDQKKWRNNPPFNIR